MIERDVPGVGTLPPCEMAAAAEYRGHFGSALPIPPRPTMIGLPAREENDS